MPASAGFFLPAICQNPLRSWLYMRKTGLAHGVTFRIIRPSRSL